MFYQAAEQFVREFVFVGPSCIAEDVRQVLGICLFYLGKSPFDGASHIGGDSSDIFPMTTFGNDKAVHLGTRSIFVVAIAFRQGLVVFLVLNIRNPFEKQ